jgi:bifunctional non-homologous end joining protein LigD
VPSKKPADALATYAQKRDFKKTPEPSDAPAKSKPSRGKDQRFVVQMHRATRLHYDFRLEDEGVLKSWAIPKGPSLDMHEKRLAMHVEDHPLDYRDFEGIIPKGNYGAGEVVVWDRGTYRLAEGTSTTEQIAKGSLKFELFGKKLHGIFALVHIKGRGGEENAWLLIKERDEFVDPKWRIEDHPESVKSGKTLADFAKDPKAPHWISNRPLDEAPAKPKLAGRREKMPDIESPMLATAIDAPFDDPKWLFELKWDGYRALARIDADGDVALVSRNGQDFTPKFPELVSLADAFSERPLLLDGEIAVLDAEGRPSFSALQERLDRFGRMQPEKRPVTFVVFDVLYGNGRDLRDEPLEKRKTTLAALLTGRGPVMLSKHVVGDGIGLFEVARSRGLEGIVGKRTDSKYVARRSRDWVKIKTQLRQETVVGGWTEARGSRSHFGALLVGVHERGEFVYAGSVGTGFDGKKLASIAAKLAPLERKTSPFVEAPKTDTRAHWVTPELVAEVSFAEWTRDRLMRQPVFVSLRADKAPGDVTREITKSVEHVEAAATPAKTLKTSASKSKGSVTLEIDGHTLSLSNPDKVLWPQDGYTKSDLVAYYRAAAPYMVPELRGRPLTLERFPDGIDESSFFEKHAPKYLPAWIETVPVPSDSGRRPPIPFMICNDEAALVYVANLAAIILHVWTSRAGTLATPDFLFFDLDPSEDCKLATLAKVALALRASLTEIGLVPVIKSSGGYGLHVAVPLVPEYDYAFAKGFGEIVARHVHAAVPDLTTLVRMPDKRPPATVYLDYVQIGKGKTLVAPYSVRARAKAPISMPLDWSEIEAMLKKRVVGTEGEFARFTIKNGPPMFADRSPLWNSQKWKEQRLEPALEKARKAWT